MTFLAPALGLVAGVLGTLGVLVSYFLKLRRRPMRVASTLLWEQAVQDLQVNAPFRWLRASWLLALQLLIVACVALALARPAIEGDGPDADRVILILDTSASMSASDGASGTTRFEEARERALDRLRRLSRSAQVMVIASAGSAETVMGFTLDHAAARAVVRALEPTDQPGDLTDAMRVVGAFARSTSEEEDQALPAIWLYTDGGDVPRAGLGVPLPADRVVIERVGPAPGEPLDNTGIAAIAARRDFDDPALVRLFARLVNARAQPATVLVQLLVDGDAVEAKRVEVPGTTEGGLAGEASVTFQLRDTNGVLALLSIAGDDALDADDQAAVMLAPPSAPRLLVVQPEAQATTTELNLVDAMYAVDPASVERIPSDQYTQRAAENAFFGAYDLIVFDGVRPGTLPPVPTLSMGATVPIPGLVLEDADASSQRVAFWSRSHPVMRYVGLGDVIVSAPKRLRFAEDGPARAEVLASGETGTLIGAIESDGLRRVLIAFRLNQSTWERYDSFPIFVGNAVDWLTLTSARESAAGATTGRPASLFDDALVGGVDVTLSGPGGVSHTGVSEPSGRVVFGVLPKAGLYTATLPSGPRTLAVNLTDAGESALRTTEAPIIAGGTPLGSGDGGGAGTREIWRWCVLGAAVLLALEWLLFAWKMRL